MASLSPFHLGEHAVQARLGVRDVETWARKVVRSYLPEEHREFYAALPFLVAAARDAEGRPWATLLAGPEGFAHSPDPRTLVIDAHPVSGDALEGALRPGVDLGLLGIELATRRRNRVNGRVANGSGDGALVLEVEQTFGNCPQHIHERKWRRVDDHLVAAPRRRERLNAAQRSWIEAADTFFIASGHRGEGESASFGMDASHRGGEPGFVQVEGDSGLAFPDYAGNNHFNTIGNLVLDPRAGLLFVDFTSGSLLQLTGRTSLVWEGPEMERFPSARRIVRFQIDTIVELPAALPLRWSDSEAGTRPLRVLEKIRESEDVTSFVFAACDGGAVASFEAGQHLPIEIDVPGHRAPVRRTYSISSAPGGDQYRISVKREAHGLASRHLHDGVEVGAVVMAREPAGKFVLGCSECPVALISAGIGLTPLVSMLHQLVDANSASPIWWLHGARDGAHHPLAGEVRELEQRGQNLRTRIAYSHPRPEDTPGIDYDLTGRITGASITDFVDDPDAQYYLCGPVNFMADLLIELEARGVAPERIHTESFGPRAGR